MSSESFLSIAGTESIESEFMDTGSLHCRMCCAKAVLSAWVGLLVAYNGRNILYHFWREI